MIKKPLLTLAIATFSLPSMILAENATPTASSSPAPSPTQTQTNAAKRPNIIFFLMDDLGWKDLSCMGSTFYESPAIDQLAADGFKFTRGYEAAPRCVPSRLSILTGKDHNRPELRGDTGLPLDQVVYASLFKDAGYSTFFAGKWHEGQKGFWPQDHGFEINKGGCSLGALTTHFWPYYNPDKPAKHATREDHNVAPYGLEQGKPGEYIADRLTDETIQFLKDHKKDHPDKPFFIELSHYLVHEPLEGKPELVKHFEEKLKTMPKDDGPEYEADYTGKVKMKQNLPVYAAMVKSIDESVDRIRKTLVELGYDKDTIIVLAGDNGGLSTTDLLGNRGMATSNKPLRTGKGWLYEGGMRVPMMVYWPGVTKPGTVSDRAVTGTDFFPTFLDMAGLPLRPDIHLDGESFAPVLKGDMSHPRKTIFWYYDGARVATGNPAMAAMLDGDMKLVHFVYEDRDELYNIHDDLGEHHDLAPTHPEKVKEMKAALADFENRVGVKPLKGHVIEEIKTLLDELKGIKPEKKSKKGKAIEDEGSSD